MDTQCRKQLEAILKPSEVVKYAVAIKDKDFLWDILYDKIYDHAKRMEVIWDAGGTRIVNEAHL